ncbi:ribonuclease Z [Borrelia recurrentis]|uniref:Ribonuclease Z n=1 Tax=Borrelia recurrentis (strain A1) TaxID=412418 RepID=RNZ_BORRA|nr:ribonuclease Z [Borrelia recurrentis]B5RQ92.1 RecName: Full=Ribonuclease Z; Short=RNase Z; AltName: Full=tRNA 3 endonuclease; AltName: Full=tRNase Z [Borrelia recurrentis A1]ACH94976.1 ribonuclease Z [Borrelia recurrentis A1]
MNFNINILGTGGTRPLHNRYLTSVLIEYHGESILFDCGEATQMSLRKQKISWQKIKMICITHLHADHITGLLGIVMLMAQSGDTRKEPLTIIGPIGIKKYLETNIELLRVHKNYQIIYKEIIINKTEPVLYEDKRKRIEYIKLKHSIDCIGYLFIEKDKPGKFDTQKAESLNIPKGPIRKKLQEGYEVILNGRKIVPSEILGEIKKGLKFAYITDTAYFEELSTYIQNFNLVIIESTFKDDLKEEAKKKLHLTAKLAAQITKKAKVYQTGLIHFSERYTLNKDLYELLNEAQQEYPNGNIFLAKDGMKLKANKDKFIIK